MRSHWANLSFMWGRAPMEQMHVSLWCKELPKQMLLSNKLLNMQQEWYTGKHLRFFYLLNCWCVSTNPSNLMGNFTSQLPTMFWILKSKNFAGKPSFWTTLAYFLAARRDCSSLKWEKDICVISSDNYYLKQIVLSQKYETGKRTSVLREKRSSHAKFLHATLITSTGLYY